MISDRCGKPLPTWRPAVDHARMMHLPPRGVPHNGQALLEYVTWMGLTLPPVDLGDPVADAPVPQSESALPSVNRHAPSVEPDAAVNDSRPRRAWLPLRISTPQNSAKSSRAPGDWNGGREFVAAITSSIAALRPRGRGERAERAAGARFAKPARCPKRLIATGGRRQDETPSCTTG